MTSQLRGDVTTWIAFKSGNGSARIERRQSRWIECSIVYASGPEVSDMKIRKERPADVSGIDDVVTQAFRAAPHTSHTEQFIVRALREAGLLTLSLVAEDEGRIVGHVALSPVTISSGAKDWYGLGPMSVMPAHQGEGIGSRLIIAALDELRSLGAAGCVVLGEPGYYGRFGFKAHPGLMLADVPPQYFQAISFGTVLPSGTVRYHDAFQATA